MRLNINGDDNITVEADADNNAVIQVQGHVGPARLITFDDEDLRERRWAIDNLRVALAALDADVSRQQASSQGN